MSTLLGILADDLTGACDSAAPFHARGLRTVVALRGQWTWPEDAAVVALDTDSRALAPEEAATRVRAAGEALLRAGVRDWFKKVDSTLRGNVGAEIEAALAIRGARLALLAPSFPANERHVREGILSVGAGTSATTVDARALLSGQLSRPPTLVGLGQVERGPAGLAEMLRPLLDGPPTVALVDATSDAHLRAIAQAGRLLGDRCLLAGSGGLSAALAEQAPLGPRYEPAPSPGPVLVLIGTLHPRTRGQLSVAAERLGVPPLEIPTGPDARSDAVQPVLASVRETLRQRGVALLTTAAERPEPADDARAAERLAQAALPLLREDAVAGVVASGGDTVAALCRALGAGLLELGDEVLVGMPQARLLGGLRPGLPLVTKSGGFGPPDALVQAVRALQPTPWREPSR
jgi:uncharacterized protein YgbK (DUF1537 family)